MCSANARAGVVVAEVLFIAYRGLVAAMKDLLEPKFVGAGFGSLALAVLCPQKCNVVSWGCCTLLCFETGLVNELLSLRLMPLNSHGGT